MNKQQIEVTSKRFWLNSKDFLKGLIIAIGTGTTFVLEPLINQWMTGTIEEINWKLVIRAGIGAGVVYLGKNLFQPQQIKINASPEKIEEIKNTLPTQEAAK